MNTKDYFAELFELSNNCKRLTKERTDALLKAEEKLIEAWKMAGNLKPVDVKLSNGREYRIGATISSNGFGTPEFKTTGIAFLETHYLENWDYDENKPVIEETKYHNNGFWSYGNYSGKEDKEVLEYYKDFPFIKEKFEQFLKDRIEKIKGLKSIEE